MNRTQILSRKKELLEKVLEIAAQIKPLLDSEDINAINTRMDERQKIIQVIDNLDKEFAQSERDDEDAVAHLNEKIKDILKEIVRIDKESIHISKGKVKKYSAQLKSVKQVKKGIGGYKKSIKLQDSVYFDEKK